MKLVARFSGDGWLRAEGFGSSTAAYDLKVFRHTMGPRIGALETEGKLLSETLTMIEASIRKWGTLIMANGKSVRIDISSVSSKGIRFTVNEPIPGMPD